MSYLRPAWEEHAREEAFRVYLTDAAQVIAENTARIGGGRTISKRWADIAGLNGPSLPADTRADTRTAEEIIADVAGKAGLIITHEHI